MIIKRNFCFNLKFNNNHNKIYEINRISNKKFNNTNIYDYFISRSLNHNDKRIL